MKLSFTIDETEVLDTDFTIREFRLILADALYEFKANRGPTPQEYVDRRYPKTEGYDDKFRENKAKQVRRRRELSEILHLSIWNLHQE